MGGENDIVILEKVEGRKSTFEAESKHSARQISMTATGMQIFVTTLNHSVHEYTTFENHTGRYHLGGFHCRLEPNIQTGS